MYSEILSLNLLRLYLRDGLDKFGKQTNQLRLPYHSLEQSL